MSGTPPADVKDPTVYDRRELGAIAARWDARADSWEQGLQDPACHLQEGEAYSKFERLLRRYVTGRREFCARQGVIDAGCGTGLVLAGIINRFAWGIGVDISPRMIAVAREKQLPNATWRVGDCFQMASLGSQAGAVVSRGVLLSHYGRGSGREFLRAAHQALVPGGFLVTDFLNAEARATARHAPEEKTWFEKPEVEELARQVGFSRVAIRGRPGDRVRWLTAEV